ncbi:MAG TPA: hypothetical protein PJ990_15685, partial [Saprospiraceae bacterium]|nr:hypothetical protein [Saprospiraceae bacterium]
MTPSIFFVQLREMTHIMLETFPFIVNNKLWRGFMKHRLALTFIVIACILIAWSLVKYVKTNTEALY